MLKLFGVASRLTKSSNVIRCCASYGVNRNYSTRQNEHFEDMMKTTTNPKLSYATTSSNIPMLPYRVHDFIHMQAEKIPNNLLYGFPHQGVNLTFGEVKQRVQAMVQKMASIGLVKGDRIALALPNCYELVIAFLAASELGLISVIMNPAYQAVEFEYMLKKTNAKALFVYDTFKILNHIQMINKMCPELESSRPGELNSKVLPDLKHVIVLNSPLSAEKKTYKGTYQYSEFSKPPSQNFNLEIPYIDLEDPCVIMFSSGTTGRPKGAVLNHLGLVMGAYVPTMACGNPSGLTMIGQPIPIFHIMGLVTGVLIPLTMGTPIVFPFYFPDTLTTLKSIQGYKCVTIRGTPTQYIDLINHPERKNYNLTSLENAIIGGAPVPLDLVQKMKDILGIKTFIIGFGMTETSCNHSLTTHADKYLRSDRQVFESLGRPMPFTESKIVDPATGQMVPLETDGELYVRGPHIIKKYWDEEEQTKQAFDHNGWLKTGDICSMDADGFLYYKSRSKDVIIRGGANLYPAEIESYLRTHPEVIDAQVFGVPDNRVGEEICAWIRLKPESKVDENAIKAYCKDNISHFKIPRYIKFVDAYPINANNKVLKRSMRDAAIKELKLDQ